jgi:hypothetical protein
MSFRHPRVLAWEAKLKSVFDLIDAEMEREYGDRYPLHPARAEHGATANAEDDGLFDLGAAFSAGFGSRHGRGYVVQVRLATLKRVPPDAMETIERRVAERLREELPRAFPGRELRIERDEHAFKIVGDLGLDERC